MKRDEEKERETERGDVYTRSKVERGELERGNEGRKSGTCQGIRTHMRG